MSDRYVDRVLEGTAVWTDVDNYVDRWHRSDSDEELHDYLGFTWEEYALWTEQPRALRFILAARERGEPVQQLLEHSGDVAVAARGLTKRDAQVILEWLRETGRLPDDS
ncbi:MAG: hypothetical protein QOI91_1283 [Solirubrobacteraceae bacterium]|jgi:hypothetical protein|nr:hypothetical protein [Solirubrobacteraceae bacterium]